MLKHFKQTTREQRLLMLGGSIAMIGLALVGTDTAVDISAWIVLAGLVLFMFQIHRFGRLGTDVGPRAEGKAKAKRRKRRRG